MKVQLFPQTKLGRWAVGLSVLMPVFFVVGGFIVGLLYPGVPAGNSVVDDVRVRPLLAAVMLLGMLSGLAAFAASWMSLVKKGERSVLVMVAALAGTWLVFMLVGELIVQH